MGRMLGRALRQVLGGRSGRCREPDRHRDRATGNRAVAADLVGAAARLSGGQSHRRWRAAARGSDGLSSPSTSRRCSPSSVSITTTVLTPAEIAAAVLKGGTITIRQPFACEIKRARVNGQPRVEIAGAPAEQLPWLKSIGCFTEIIQYRTRVFVPIDRASEIIERLTGTR